MLTFIFSLTRPLEAKNLEGVQNLLRKIETERHKPSQKSLTQLWQEDMDNYQKNHSSFPPQEAAKKWLDLYARLWKLKKEESNQDYYTLQSMYPKLIQNLPKPQVWKILHKAALNKKDSQEAEDIILRYITYFLNKDASGMMTSIKELQAMDVLVSVWSRIVYKDRLNTMVNHLQHMTGTVEERIEAFLNNLELKRSTVEDIYLPDFTNMVPEEQAKQYIERALKTDHVRINVIVSPKTLELAQRIALELIDQLQIPQWGLIRSVDAVELFEAMQKKFQPAPKPGLTKTAEANKLPEFAIADEIHPENQIDDLSRQSYQKAKIYYMVGLIIQHRIDEAKVIASEEGVTEDIDFSYELLRFLNQSGYKEELYAFLYAILKEKPISDFWPAYIQLSVDVGKQEEMIGFLKSTLEIRQLPPVAALKIQKHLFEAYLAIDNIKEAGQVLKQIDLKSFNQSFTKDKIKNKNDINDLAEKLIKSGKLLNKNDWVQLGFKILDEEILLRQSKKDWKDINPRNDLAQKYIDIKDYKKAEKILLEGILELSKNYDENFYDLNALLAKLIFLYYKTQNYSQVIALVDQYPYWSAKDLKDIISYFYNQDEKSGFILAKVFNETNNKSIANRMAKEMIQESGGHDPSYELLVNNLGKELIPWLDQIFQTNPFEERPLIWKAQILFNEKNYDQALDLVKKAIAIDPSDGEQGKDRRMRAYALLADIYAAQGNKEDSQLFQNVVKAIRLSETADDYYSAGLIQRGIQMYEKALALFNDAYCIQSRIAIALEAKGKFDLAEKHFVKAFELMPNSFGRIESHCLGCETVFGTKMRQQLAERVFSSYLQEHPQQPQIYYLLGYLKYEQKQYQEAVQLFKQAIKLDPQYINAYKKMMVISQSIYFPLEERENIVLSILKLDPYQKQGMVDISSIWNLDKAWDILASKKPLMNQSQEPLYPLSASKMFLETKDLSDVQDHYNDSIQLEDIDRIPYVISQHQLFKDIDLLQRSLYQKY